MAQEKDWKNKYKVIFQELEEKESEWKSIDALLRKTISRLSIAGRGIDPKLDDQLKKIQKLSRERVDENLEAALQDLSQTVANLEDTPSDISEKATNEASTLLLALLQEIQFREEQRDELKSICDNLLNSLASGKNDADVKPQINKLSTLINQNFSETGTVAEPGPIDQSSTVTVHEVLTTLLEKLTVIQGGTESANLLQTEVLNHIDEDEWPQTLDKIVDCISETLGKLNKEKIELEEFIIRITQQLSKISEVIASDRENNLSDMEDRQSLQQLIQDSVKSIESDFDNASEIGQLKNIVAMTMQQIHSGIEDFVARSNQRQEAIDERNDHLVAQIATMNKKTQTLTRKLHENRKKLLYDALTGAGSRLSYDETLAQEMSRWNRYGTSFSYAILDIDFFKKINDNYGHNAGDKALRLIARMLMSEIRKADKIFRIGGEEFVLLLPDTPVDKAAALVNKLRDKIAQSPIHFNQKRVSITLSAGLTAPVENDNIESLYERADKALYKAKHSGRNCQFTG
ncbi:MAG: diguanylate cyclase [Gammaproteobacteria bacterium]|nr:diguanylate cyclase [Gammaproteobacteria bacterium]